MNWKILKLTKSRECYQKNNIVRKIYKNRCIQKMSNEINALHILRKYKHFPKILNIDWDNFSIDMTYVGDSIINKNLIELPNDILKQFDSIENILKKNKIHHNDLALSHFMLKNDILYLIDFEKVIIERDDTLFTQYNPSYIKNRYVVDIKNKLINKFIKK